MEKKGSAHGMRTNGDRGSDFLKRWELLRGTCV